MKTDQYKKTIYLSTIFLATYKSAFAGTGGVAFKGLVTELINYINGYVGLGIVIVLLGIGFWRLAGGNIGSAIASLIGGLGLAALPAMSQGIITAII